MTTSRISFWTNTKKLTMASYRIRCRNVVQDLRQLGVRASYYDGRIRKHTHAVPALSRPPILVLSKHTKLYALEWAVELKNRYGTRLVLDVCDNIFFGKEAGAKAEKDKKYDQTIGALRHFDVVVTPTAALRDLLARHLRSGTHFEVIPDAVENKTGMNVYQKWKNRHSIAELHSLQESLANNGVNSGHRLVWYGYHGMASAQNGMQDLASISNILEKHNKDRKLSLTVISNNRQKYDDLFGKASFQTHYLEWNYYTISQSLKLHDIALIPVRENDFNTVKSANRVTTAFENDLAVCASSLDSYAPFSDSAVLDDWGNGLGLLMSSAEERKRRISLGKERIDTEFTQRAVSHHWMNLIEKLT